jgi:glycosyltransferase involved in cell wall biosynthesis
MDLSVIIPARNEQFLQQTIDNILKNIRANTEIIVILDGYWPAVGIPQHKNLVVIHHESSIGQRAAVNEGAKLSRAKYIMKLDGHCMVGKGFDIKLMADCEYDWTVIPRMYNLHAFNWRCKQCENETYQGPTPKKCKKCDSSDLERKMYWKPRKSRCTDFMRFDANFKFQYWSRYKSRPEAKGDICDLMSSVGACFFMHRQRFFDLGGMDEGHGSWGQFGTEVACKAWLSGGRHVVNKKTWFAHMFRTQGGDFGFPYPISGKQVRTARKYSRNLWGNDSWPLATRKVQWLINKFAPIPDWHEKDPKNENRPPVMGPGPFGIESPGKTIASESQPTKGCVYYTDNQCEERVLDVARRQLKRAVNGYPIISVSQFPINFGDKNIVMNLIRSNLTMFKQILAGIKNIDTDIVFLTEHDVLYHPSHFEFTPLKKNVFYYNQNIYKVRYKDGQGLFYYSRQTSGVCGYRDLFLEHYEKRVKIVEEHGFKRRMGFEPGTHKPPRGVDNYTSECYMSELPNVDIRHRANLTGSRFKKEQYRSQRSIKGWKLVNEIPGWGITKNRFDDFLFEVDLRGGAQGEGGQG